MTEREAEAWAERTLFEVARRREQRRRHWKNVGWHVAIFVPGFIAIWFLDAVGAAMTTKKRIQAAWAVAVFFLMAYVGVMVTLWGGR